jgi:hypothetical protein
MKNQLLALILGSILLITNKVSAQPPCLLLESAMVGNHEMAQHSHGHSQAIILTVNFSEFTASIIQGKKAKLDWETASEENTSSFIIERSKEGRNFEEIGRIIATGSSGNVNRYSFIDDAPRLENTYRIKTVDLDGKTGYSKSICIKLNGMGGRLSAFPNPVKDNLQVQTKMKGNLVVKLYDATGNLVLQKTTRNDAGEFSFALDLTRFSKGIYVITVENGSALEKLQFIKE